MPPFVLTVLFNTSSRFECFELLFLLHSIWWQFPILWHSSFNNAKFNSFQLFGQKFLLLNFVLGFNFCFIFLHTERMNHFGNAFVPCGVVYYIDTYNAQSTTINFAYESQNWAYMEPQQMFSSPISTATTPWWTTTPVKERCTPGTTSVWSLILSLPPQK